jgi:transcriptional regulator with XRE-family HTH domain
MAEAIDPRKPDSSDVEVGSLVRVHRIARGMSQTELGNHIGVTFQQIQKYEIGANRISMGRLTRIAHVFGVSVPYMLAGSRQSASMTEAKNPTRADTIDVEVGRLVRVQRIARGLSQTELADRIGVTFQQVQKYESGANRISMGRLTRIGRVLGVDITYLLGANRKASVTGLQSKQQAEATRMLGRPGAVRLLKAFHKLPERPSHLRETVVRLVEGAASIVMDRSETRRRSASRRTRVNHF